MSKPKDFTSDLANLSHSVEAEFGTIMEVLREKKNKQTPQPSSTETASTQNVANGEGSLPRGIESTVTAPRSAASPPRQRQRPALSAQTVLQNVTTRLRRETNELLTEAALRQRLKNESPDTRQDIMEEALQYWFRRKGYAQRPAAED